MARSDLCIPLLELPLEPAGLKFGGLGYYLGYAYVPEQLFKDGVVQLAVLEGTG